MLRSLLIYLSKAAWARRIVMGLPFARRTARRFVPGETLDEAVAAVKSLNEAGMLATLDLLGEHTANAGDAAFAAQQILDTLNAISASGLKSGVSIKLTQIGLKLDEEICRQNLQKILEHAQSLGLFVRMDMEDSDWVEPTLRLYRQMRSAGFTNAGVVIQSYLYRSDADVVALLEERAPIRLVKGAYMEPPDRAYPQKADVDASFDKLADRMLHSSLWAPVAVNANGSWPPIAALASHDSRRVEFARNHAEEIELPREKLEFQMLYGIRRDLQTELRDAGYPVRVYVPFGKEWYPYFMRRLAERPANLWFFLSNLFRR